MTTSGPESAALAARRDWLAQHGTYSEWLEAACAAEPDRESYPVPARFVAVADPEPDDEPEFTEATMFAINFIAGIEENE